MNRIAVNISMPNPDQQILMLYAKGLEWATGWRLLAQTNTGTLTVQLPPQKSEVVFAVYTNQASFDDCPQCQTALTEDVTVELKPEGAE
jgi:hypothetical protein